METEGRAHGKADNCCSDVNDLSATNNDAAGSGLVLTEQQLSEIHDRSIRFAASVIYDAQLSNDVLRVRSRMSASFKEEAGCWWFRPRRTLMQLYDTVCEHMDFGSSTQFWRALDAWMDAKQAALDARHQTWLRRVVLLNEATPAEQEKHAREQLVDRFTHDFTLSRANADLLSWSLQSESSRLSCVEKLVTWYWMLDPARRRSFAAWHRRFQVGPAWDRVLRELLQWWCSSSVSFV